MLKLLLIAAVLTLSGCQAPRAVSLKVKTAVGTAEVNIER